MNCIKAASTGESKIDPDLEVLHLNDLPQAVLK
jgi:hypothetical protein